MQLGQLLDQVCRQLVGFATGCAVADGNQVHAMFFAQFGQGEQSAIPVFARLMRVHRGGLDQFARRVHHRHLDASPDARVQAHHHAGAGGRGQQQVTQIVGKHLDSHFFSLFTQSGKQVALGR